VDIPDDADLTSAFAAEIERNRAVAKEAGTVASAVGVDAQNWKFTRVLVLENEPVARGQGNVYQVLYLAQTLLDTLTTAQAAGSGQDKPRTITTTASAPALRSTAISA